MNYIVTHNGAAHQDDFLASAIAVAKHPTTIVVRREPTAVEVNNPEVLVLDVGMVHNPLANTFDHHQEGCDTCALALYMEHLYGKENVPSWVDVVTQQDTTGPMNTAKSFGIKVSDYYGIKGPVTQILINMFAEKQTIQPDDLIHKIMVEIGTSIDKEIAFRKERLACLSSLSVYKNKSGHTWLDLRGVTRPNMYIREAGLQSDYRLVDNTREGGKFNLLACGNGLPKIVVGDNIEWAHKDGFIGTLKEGIDPIEFMNSL